MCGFDEFLRLNITASPYLIASDKQLAADDRYSLKAAVLSNGTHILIGLPPGTLKPIEPTTEGEELTIQIPGDSTTHKVKVEKKHLFRHSHSEQVEEAANTGRARLPLRGHRIFLRTFHWRSNRLFHTATVCKA
jgi:hypothetical protein